MGSETHNFWIAQQPLGHDLRRPQFSTTHQHVNVGSILREICKDSVSTLVGLIGDTGVHVASSAAESPPPMTANGLFLKIGTAPSQTAQAEMPLCQYVCSPLSPRRFALAPVAMIIVSALSGSPSSWYSRQYLKGRRERSIFDTVSVMMRVPNRRD